MTKRILVLASCMLGAAAPGTSDQHLSDTYSMYVDAEGQISKPKGYRTNWSHLGSFAVHDADGSHSFHDTYAQPEAVEHYRKHGEFPDGAVLVKEVRGSDTAKMTTGDATWAEDIQVWFVMIKDAKNRFPDNPLWGDGWGWALYKPDAPEKQAATDYKSDCLGCHIPARDDDWVYVGGYPTLRGK